eukprot:TRINITY_DN4664_c0_g1_i16.p2 TRINITY_DN4664_c0_g1~~TRINITY_DN4664_c0_g1_i16.p2  ORF type:complete len:187 (+),score=32.23 TRINITY_DN4664_c0_g1_i16:837-1397(+)
MFRSRLRLVISTVFLVLVFLSRSIRDLLVGLGHDPIQLQECLPVSVQIQVFMMMLVWELIPAVIVIFLFWHIPNPSESKTGLIYPPSSFTTKTTSELNQPPVLSTSGINYNYPDERSSFEPSKRSYLFSEDTSIWRTSVGDGGGGGGDVGTNWPVPSTLSGQTNTLPTFQRGDVVFSSYNTTSHLK